MTYRAAGVDIERGNRLVERIKSAARGTVRDGLLAGIGGFGALFELPLDRYRRPVLVSGTDGVGTKLKLAIESGRHAGVGIDLVAMCVNDILTLGAEPLFFLDYYASARLDEDTAATVIEGIAAGCREAGAALIGGETAEMPDLYEPGEFDIAGTIVGVVEKNKILDGSRIRKGDVLLGLQSTGLHTNGFTLARRIIELSSNTGYHTRQEALGSSIGDALLAPHKSYYGAITLVRDHPAVHGIAHITGGGLVDNMERLFPERLHACIDWDAWQPPGIFALLQHLGEIDDAEMRRVFNLGIGLVLIVDAIAVEKIANRLQAAGEPTLQIGTIA